VAPAVTTLDFARRVELSAHWSKLGSMEHASVAAFARFLLELLALGAPADLVRDTQRALADEIAHAELCFGLASAYGAQAVAPGPLPLEGALDARSRFEIVRTAFLEACVGETLAAVEARLALDRARDVEVRRALARIADDEARHAELGWRFVQWAIATSSAEDAEELRAALRTIVDAESALSHPPGGDTPTDERLADHGMPSEATRQRARELAFSELILPWTNAVLSETSSRAA
jgi:hypothetical protein